MVHKKFSELGIGAQFIAITFSLVYDFNPLEETVTADVSHPRILFLDRFSQPLREIQTHIQRVLLYVYVYVYVYGGASIPILFSK